MNDPFHIHSNSIVNIIFYHSSLKSFVINIIVLSLLLFLIKNFEKKTFTMRKEPVWYSYCLHYCLFSLTSQKMVVFTLWLKVLYLLIWNSGPKMVVNFSNVNLFFTQWWRGMRFRDSVFFTIWMSDTMYSNISWNLNCNSFNIIKALFLPVTEACNYLHHHSLQLLGKS